METSEIFSLEAHGIDVVVFDQMIGSLELEDQQAVAEALEIIPEDRREFLPKILRPYLRKFDEVAQTDRDAAIFKHAYVGMNAILHAAALTHLPYSVSLLDMTVHQSEVFLQRVISMVFFYPMDVASAFHRDETFIDAVCGAGMQVLQGDTGIHYVEELAEKGKQARNAVCIENLTSA